MKQFYSTQEAARLLGISRVALFRRIQAGELKAEKVGRNYIINSDDLPLITAKEVSASQKLEIEQVVKKTIAEYGEALRLLKDA